MSLLGRPFRDATHCAEEMLRNWNGLVEPDDTVYVIGDWCLDKKWLEEWTPRFNGRKTLALGNYDQLAADEYASYFEAVCKSFSLKIEGEKQSLDVHGVHYPSLSISRHFCLVGHIHGCWRVQKNMLNVGIDSHHFRPLSVEQVLFFYNGICDFYDEDVWVGDHPANVAHEGRGKTGTYWQRDFKGTAHGLD